MLNPLENLDLAQEPGSVGDVARDQIANPPGALETPSDTAARMYRQTQQVARVQRTRTADLVARDIPTYTDPTGNVDAVRDETGAALTQYDKKNRIAYDSAGNPRKLTYGESGSPKQSDPFEAVRPTTDPKTGEIYKITPGLPWQRVGQDAEVKAAALRKEQDAEATKLSRLYGRSLTLDEKDAASDKVAVKHGAEALQGMLSGTTLPPDSDLPTVQKAIEDHFNGQYAADDANQRQFLGFKQNDPAVVAARRAEIDQQKAAAMGKANELFALKDRLTGTKQRVEANRAQAQQLADERLQAAMAAANPPPKLYASDGKTVTFDQERPYDALTQAVADKAIPAASDEDLAKANAAQQAVAKQKQADAAVEASMQGEKLYAVGKGGKPDLLASGRPFDALHQAIADGLMKPNDELEHQAWTEQAVEEAKAGKKPYQINAQGQYQEDPQKPFDSLVAASADGVVNPLDETTLKAAADKQKLIEDAGRVPELKAALVGFASGMAFNVSAPIGAGAGTLLGLETGPGAALTGIAGGMATGAGGSWLFEQALNKLGEYSDTINSFVASAKVRPTSKFIGEMAAFGSGAPKSAMNAIGGKIAGASEALAGTSAVEGATASGIRATQAAQKAAGGAVEGDVSSLASKFLDSVAESYKAGGGGLISTVKNLSQQASVMSEGGATAGAVAAKTAKDVLTASAAMVAIDTAIKEGSNALGISEEHQTLGGAAAAALLGSFASGHGISFPNYSQEDLASILLRGAAHEKAGVGTAFSVPIEKLSEMGVTDSSTAHAMSQPLTPEEHEIFTAFGEKVLEMQGKGIKIDPEKVILSARQALRAGRAQGVRSVDIQPGEEGGGGGAPTAPDLTAPALGGPAEPSTVPPPLPKKPKAASAPATDEPTVQPATPSTGEPLPPAATAPKGPKAAPGTPAPQGNPTVAPSAEPTAPQQAPATPLASTFPAGTVIAHGDAEIHVGKEGKALTWQAVRGGQIVATGAETSMRAAAQAGKAALDQLPKNAGQPSETSGGATAAVLAPASIDQQAHAAATSPENELPHPTPAQTEAGNYQKGHIRVGGLDISVENPAGSERKGVNKAGKPWSVAMKHHYGYIKGTVGRDKDHVDVFVKPGTPSDFAGDMYVVNQVNPETGRFDEHKAVLGATSVEDARATYLANYSPGWKGTGSIGKLSMPEFKEWLKAGDQRKPIQGGNKPEAAPSSKKNEPEPNPTAPEKPAETKAETKPSVTPQQALDTAKAIAEKHGVPLEFKNTANESGIEYGGGKIRIQPNKANRTMADAAEQQKKNGVKATPEDVLHEAVREEVIHHAQAGAAEAAGETLQSYYEKVADEAMPAGWQDAGRKSRSDWEQMPSWKQKAEFVRMVVQGKWRGTITEALYRVLNDVVKFLKGAAENGSDWLKAHVAEVEKRVAGLKPEESKPAKAPKRELAKTEKPKVSPAAQSVREAIGDLLDADSPKAIAPQQPLATYEDEATKVLRSTAEVPPVKALPSERDRIIRAYREVLATRKGWKSVPIADVMERAGFGLFDLRAKGLLVDLANRGDIVSMAIADWSIAQPRERAWGIRRHGEKVLEMRMGDDAQETLSADAPGAPAYDTPVPREKREAVNALAAKLIDQHGVDTPEKLAATLSELGPKAQAYSQAVWFKMKSEGAAGPAEPDWPKIYDALAPKPTEATSPSEEVKSTPSGDSNEHPTIPEAAPAAEVTPEPKPEAQPPAPPKPPKEAPPAAPADDTPPPVRTYNFNGQSSTPPPSAPTPPPATPPPTQTAMTPGLTVGIVKGVQSLLLPSAQSPEHLRAAEVLGSKLGPMNQRQESARAHLQKDWLKFEKLGVRREDLPIGENAGIKFMSDMSMGRTMAPDMQAIADKMIAQDASRIALLERADAPLQAIRENYFPGVWTKESRLAFNLAMAEANEKGIIPAGTGVNVATSEQKAWVKARVDELLKDGKGSDKDALSYLTKTPLKGKESFRKKKVFDEDIATAFEFGLRAFSNNPVDLRMLKWAEMDRNIMANQALQEWKAKGMVKVIGPYDQVPDGWQKVNDKYGTVYGPPTVDEREYVDKNVYDGLMGVAKGLGIEPERVFRSGRGNLGHASTDGKTVSQFATELSVLAHEIGHQLDFKYNLWERVVNDAVGLGARGTPTKTASAAKRAQIGRELRALADLSWEGKNPDEVSAHYKAQVRKKAEKMAHMLEAYIHAKEKFREVAPTVFGEFDRFIKAQPETAPLADIKPGISLQRLDSERYVGLPIIGFRIVPNAVGDILNNYLSSSLYNNRYFGKLYTGWMGFANALNQTQLGVGSAFHVGFTTAEAQISAGANLIKDIFGLLRGNRGFGQALKSVKAMGSATIETAMTGDKVLNAWRHPDGVIDSRIAQVVRAAELAGGGFTMERGLQTDQTHKAVSDWFNGHTIRAALRSPVVAVEMMAHPIMSYLVPRQKAGVFAHMAWRIIDQNPGKTLEELTPEFRQAWNRIDARLGQVRYDRLFINNTAKNVVQGMVRAPGWSGGTIAELGGAFKDTYTFFEEWAKTGTLPKDVPDRVAYTISLLLTVALANALLTALFTGHAPEGLDYLAFRSGGKDEDGRPERFILPTYMKDVLAYAKEPFTTLINKAHPLLSIFGDLIRNKDYYGIEIRHEEDNAIKQALQSGGYVVKAFEPFWIRGARKEQDRESGPLRTALPFIGVMPAPKKMTQTPAERQASEYIAQERKVGARTQQEADRSDAMRKAAQQIRRGEPIPANISRYMTGHDMLNVQKRASLTPLQYQVNGLALDKAESVFKHASPKEKMELSAIMAQKRANEGKKHSGLFTGF